jgi:hypothetical protein
MGLALKWMAEEGKEATSPVLWEREIIKLGIIIVGIWKYRKEDQ